jgi:hypothetical protein
MFSQELFKKIGILLAIALIGGLLIAAPVMAQVPVKPAPGVEKAKVPVPQPKKILDGKIYDGQLVIKSSPDKPIQETITFKAGSFHSAACEKMGFGTGVYSAKKDGDNITFVTKIENKNEKPVSVLEWTGTVIVDKASSTSKLTATATLLKDGKPAEEYSVTASPRLIPTPTPSVK